MALTYNGLLISEAREEAGEVDYTATSGVPQSVPIRALKEAVQHCQNSLYLAAPQVFDVIGYIDAVVGQVEYDLPDNAYIGAAIASLEYSPNGDDDNYYPLSLTDYAYRMGGSGAPQSFVPYGDGKILIDRPVDIAGGVFRVVYGANLDKPDIRRGTIASRTLDATNYLTVTLEDDLILDETAIALNEYFCVNDKDGVVKYYNVNYTAYDTTTKVFTLGASTALADGTIAVGDYITLGRYTTTHIKLHEIAEPIALAFIRRRFYLVKSSDDRMSEEDNIAAFTKEMVASYKRRIRTQKKIPYTGRFEGIGRKI